jgi:hypothetical protein
MTAKATIALTGASGSLSKQERIPSPVYLDLKVVRSGMNASRSSSPASATDPQGRCDWQKRLGPAMGSSSRESSSLRRPGPRTGYFPETRREA